MTPDIKRQKGRKSKTPSSNQRFENLKANSELLKTAKEKAHLIVLNLLEEGISSKYLEDNISFITRENFEDVAVERSIIGICGYPLCNSSLDSKNMDKQTYVIRHNKVYDITQRRNFCSDKCYEAWDIVRRQIPTIPLYLRCTDEEVRNFRLVVPDLSVLVGKIGKRVNITGTSFDPEIDFITSGDKATNKREERQSSSDTEPEEVSTGIANEDSLEVDIDNHLSDEIQKLSIEEKNVPKTTNVRFLEKKSEKKSGENRSCSVVKNESQTSKLEDIHEVESTLREWMTFGTLRMILGDLYVKGMLEHVGKIWEDYASREPDALSSVDLRIKYVALCKKLDKEEMMEKLLDAESLVEENESEMCVAESKLVPDYEKLQQDVDQLSLKVKAFYGGAEEYVISENLETIYEEEEEEDDKISRVKRKRNTEAAVGVESDSGTLPLIDTYSQKTWRRQIVLEKLNKSLSEYSVDLGLDGGEVRRLAIDLITTFNLSSHDISFKASQWRFIALIIIKMLSVRYPPITKAFNPGEESNRVVASLLQGRGLDENYLNRLLSYLTNMSYILTKIDQKHSILNEEKNIVPDSCARTASRLEEFANQHNKIEISTNFEELD